MTNRTDPAAVARPILAQGFVLSTARPILAIDTGGRSCSVAVLGDGVKPVNEAEDTDHGHATKLMPMIERVRKAAGIDYSDLDRIAVAVGPGSFTGLRVGIAAALGLSLASGVPAVGISSFHAVALLGLNGPDFGGFRCFVLLDSRREEPFFAELGGNLKFIDGPAVMAVDAFDALLRGAGPAVVIGDAPAVARPRTAFPPSVRPAPTKSNAVMVAALAADPEHRYDLPPKPVYVRAPDVTMPKTA